MLILIFLILKEESIIMNKMPKPKNKDQNKPNNNISDISPTSSATHNDSNKSPVKSKIRSECMLPSSSPSKKLKHVHVININSGNLRAFVRNSPVKVIRLLKSKDDEEYAPASVVIENLSGSARTDYKLNHIYIERNKSRMQNNFKEKKITKSRVSNRDESLKLYSDVIRSFYL
jgi:hypothetical protein